MAKPRRSRAGPKSSGNARSNANKNAKKHGGKNGNSRKSATKNKDNAASKMAAASRETNEPARAAPMDDQPAEAVGRGVNANVTMDVEADMINAFFLPGGILDPEDMQDQAQPQPQAKILPLSTDFLSSASQPTQLPPPTSMSTSASANSDAAAPAAAAAATVPLHRFGVGCVGDAVGTPNARNTQASRYGFNHDLLPPCSPSALSALPAPQTPDSISSYAKNNEASCFMYSGSRDTNRHCANSTGTHRSRKLSDNPWDADHGSANPDDGYMDLFHPTSTSSPTSSLPTTGLTIASSAQPSLPMSWPRSPSNLLQQPAPSADIMGNARKRCALSPSFANSNIRPPPGLDSGSTISGANSPLHVSPSQTWGSNNLLAERRMLFKPLDSSSPTPPLPTIESINSNGNGNEDGGRSNDNTDSEGLWSTKPQSLYAPRATSKAVCGTGTGARSTSPATSCTSEHNAGVSPLAPPPGLKRLRNAPNNRAAVGGKDSTSASKATKTNASASKANSSGKKNKQPKDKPNKRNTETRRLDSTKRRTKSPSSAPSTQSAAGPFVAAQDKQHKSKQPNARAPAAKTKVKDLKHTKNQKDTIFGSQPGTYTPTSKHKRPFGSDPAKTNSNPSRTVTVRNSNQAWRSKQRDQYSSSANSWSSLRTNEARTHAPSQPQLHAKTAQRRTQSKPRASYNAKHGHGKQQQQQQRKYQLRPSSPVDQISSMTQPSNTARPSAPKTTKQRKSNDSRQAPAGQYAQLNAAGGAAEWQATDGMARAAPDHEDRIAVSRSMLLDQKQPSSTATDFTQSSDSINNDGDHDDYGTSQVVATDTTTSQPKQAGNPTATDSAPVSSQHHSQNNRDGQNQLHIPWLQEAVAQVAQSQLAQVSVRQLHSIEEATATWIRWLTEVNMIFAHVASVCLLVAKFVLLSVTKVLLLVASFCFLVWKYSIVEAMEENNVAICYGFFYFMPTICRMITDFAILPHWTSHLLTAVVVFTMCHQIQSPPLHDGSTLFGQLKDSAWGYDALVPCNNASNNSSKIADSSSSVTAKTTVKEDACTATTAAAAAATSTNKDSMRPISAHTSATIGARDRRMINAYQAVRARDERACRSMLRILRIVLPLFVIADGFSAELGTIIGDRGSSRLTTAFMMSLVRKNLISSPIGWISWAVQVLIATYCPAGGSVLDQVLLVIGLASIRLVRYLEMQRIDKINSRVKAQ